jgi:SNF2 family DNA or RNA helicase
VPHLAEKPDIKDAAQRLESIQTFGGIVSDTMGFGKTITALLFMSYYALYCPHIIKNRELNHRPILCLVPSGVVLNQWAYELKKTFTDLELITGHGIKPLTPEYLQNWVSATAMREAPGNLKNWPSHLRYVFDRKDPRASKTVILVSYETWADRSVTVARIKNTELQDELHGKSKPRRVYTSKWKNVFSMVCADEGHKLRHPWTKVHASVLQLHAQYHWFLSATPVVNSSSVCSIMPEIR